MRKEVFKGGDAKGVHRSGSEGAAMAVLGYTAASYALFINGPNVLTGAHAGLHSTVWLGAAAPGRCCMRACCRHASKAAQQVYSSCTCPQLHPPDLVDPHLSTMSCYPHALQVLC